MVVDSSAILAILLGEADAATYAAAIEADPSPVMSAVSLLEITLVIGARKKEMGLALLDRFIDEGRIEVVAFDAEQSANARDAWWRYGKGRHPAALNLGDCCSYALAKTRGKPLLYKGNDFLQTDLPAIKLERPGG